MQKWEYTIIYRDRGWKASANDEWFCRPEDWETWIRDSSGERKSEEKFFDVLIRLGEQGWELVSAMPVSSFLGGGQVIAGNSSVIAGTGVGMMKGMTADVAGFTSDQVWTFKRPKG